LQTFDLEPLDIRHPVGNPSFQAKIGRTFAAIAPALERALRDAEPLGELLLV
jgi:hypothetical protein